MAAQIRPTRLEVTDRFPMLGFTIRTDGPPARAEIVIATDPELFRPEHKKDRTASNFYSSRGRGPIGVPRGEAIYVVPPEALVRFIGQDRVYAALAVTPDRTGAPTEVAVLPSDGSPYISLKGLTGRSLKRVRLVPNRQQLNAGYAPDNGASLTWAGDTPAPGTEPVGKLAKNGDGRAASGNGAEGAPKPVEYDDGFGPMKDAAAPAPSTAAKPAAGNGAPPAMTTIPTSTATPAAGATAKALDVGDFTISGDKRPVTPPSVKRLESWQATLVQGAIAALSGPFAPVIATLPSAAKAAGVSIGVGPSVGAGLGGGIGLGAGVVFGPDGGIGVYGAVEFDVGFLASISAQMQVTIVGGGIESFNGWGMAAAISGGEGVVGSAAALFDMRGNFQGVSFGLGVGAGLTPVDFYIAIQRQAATSFALAQGITARTRSGTTPLPKPRPRQPAYARSRALDAGGPDVDIKLRVFIPAPIVTAPVGDYGGDGRSFSYSAGTSRGEIHATVHLTPGGGIAGIDTLDRHWGESTQYDEADTIAVDGKPDWWRDKRDGATPTNRKTLALTDDNLKIYVGSGGTTRNVQATVEQASIFTMEVAGGNPLVPGSPDIDADLSVMVRLRGDAIEAKVVGSHDGFPSYEIYANQTCIYSYDPVAAGNTPMALMPPMDIDVDNGWQTVGSVTGVQTMAARALDAGLSYSINWDDVESIPQPTNFSCWATAGAMVVGWRDQMSLSADSIAQICGRTTATGLDPAQVGQFAQEIGLTPEAPQCYTVDGFRRLLEAYGPLWVAADVPGLHAIVVTGFYSDGTNNYVRITDPWDRTVGTPGAPGAYLPTHTTGSRYIMKWEDFVAEYEAAAIDYSSVNLQILHAAGVGLRLPNRGKPADYAQSLAARAYPVRPFDMPAMKIASKRVPVKAPEVDELGWVKRNAIKLAIQAVGGPLGLFFSILPALANEYNVSIGIGPSIGGGLGAGASLGGGIIFAPDDKLGVYGSIELDVGFITGLSATVQVTVVKGGIDSFNGWGFAATVSGGEGVVGGASALFDSNGNFTGVTGQIGVGLGFSPVDFYIAIQRQYSTELALQQARMMALTGMPAVSARAFDASNIKVASKKVPVKAPAVDELGWTARNALKIGIAALGGPLGIFFSMLPELADKYNVTFGIGPSIGGGLGAGASIGAGIIIAPDDTIGVYGSIELDVGFITGLSATVQMTVIKGGINSFNGWSLAATVTGGEGVVGGASALFDAQGNFTGVTFQAGIGAAFSPVDFYIAIQRQFSTELALAQARAMAAPAGRRALPSAPVARSRKAVTYAAAADDAAATTRRREAGSASTASWQLDQLDGLKRPAQASTTPLAVPAGARQVRLDDWPFVPASDGVIQMPLTVAWRFDNGAIGDVKITADAPRVAAGWGITASADITDGADAGGIASLRVCVRQAFGRAGSTEAVGVTDLTLFGDGTYQRQDRWEQAQAAA